MWHELREARKSALRSSVALTALARSHDDILAATEQAPSVGHQVVGPALHVTKYLPHDPKYGKSTRASRRPSPRPTEARIVAVDPKLIPYGSWVVVETSAVPRRGLSVSAIKGFRLDLLTATEEDAVALGKQNRFAIVVPQGDSRGSSVQLWRGWAPPGVGSLGSARSAKTHSARKMPRGSAAKRWPYPPPEGHFPLGSWRVGP